MAMSRSEALVQLGVAVVTAAAALAGVFWTYTLTVSSAPSFWTLPGWLCVAGLIVGFGILLTAWWRGQPGELTPEPPAAPRNSVREVVGPGAIGIVEGDGNSITINHGQSTGTRRSALDVVRVELSPGTPDESFPTIDVTVRNTGEVAALVREMTFDDVRVWPFPASAFPHALPASWTYQADLGGGSTHRVRLSQEVRPGRLDRFDVVLGTSNPIYPFVGHFLYQFRCALVVDREQQVLPLGIFLVRLPQPMIVTGLTTVGSTRSEAQARQAQARELASTLPADAVVSGPARAALDELLALDRAEPTNPSP